MSRVGTSNCRRGRATHFTSRHSSLLGLVSLKFERDDSGGRGGLSRPLFLTWPDSRSPMMITLVKEIAEFRFKGFAEKKKRDTVTL